MFKNILVPVDLEDTRFALQAIEVALRELDNQVGKLHLLTVIPGFTSPLVASFFDQASIEKAHKAIDQRLMDFANQAIPSVVPFALSVKQGHPAETIIDHAKHTDVDLIIMAAHHRSRLDHALLGSVSSRVVERADCSVTVLRQKSKD
jgi:universal stress protein F